MNASYEQDSDRNGYPDHWSEHEPTGERDDGMAHSGRSSLMIPGPSHDVYSEQLVRLKPNTQYTMSAYVRTENVTGRGVWLRYAELVPGTVVHMSPAATGSGDWRRISATFTTMSDYESGRLDVYWQIERGIAWIDDVSICEGPAPCEGSGE
jgi:hypothetical protein